MGITGGIKFFEQSKCEFKNGGTIAASTNDDSAKFVIDSNKYTIWESIGSNDLTTETLTLTFQLSSAIDRLYLTGINWKKYQIKYHNGVSYVDFTTVVGLDGALGGGISETTYDKSTAYYEFDSISTDRIQITIDTTQTVDVEKEVTTIIPTLEIGTFEGYPRIRRPRFNRNIKGKKNLSGKYTLIKTFETYNVSIQFKTYPVQNDIDIVDTLHDSEEPFLIWKCGGRYGKTYFTREIKGFRLEDVFKVQINRPVSYAYASNIYTSGVNSKMDLVEVA